MPSLLSKPLQIALGISLGVASMLMATSYFYTREAVFLCLNKDMGAIADQVFNTFTHLAEGWMWIPFFILLFGYFKKDALFLLSNFLISTLLTQFPKLFIWSSISRPMASGIDHKLIHTVPGVEMHLWNSFPSGHTATAFTFYFVMVYFFPSKKMALLGFLFAAACGYSRVYLGQHFPLDVAGGIVVAIATIITSIYIRKTKNNVSEI
jgi:membrane-associated phospholipid phosphatase